MQQCPSKARVVCIPCTHSPFFSSLLQSFCPSCFSLSFSLSELAQCANVSTLPFICQSPEQCPAPSVYLCLYCAAPSALLFSSSPFPPSFLSLENPSILHPFYPLFSTSIPHFLHLNTLSFPLCCICFLHTPLCHGTSIFYTILASPIHSPYPSANPLFHGSWHFIEVTS